jgi:ketosteroid isomerase-like protein
MKKLVVAFFWLVIFCLSLTQCTESTSLKQKNIPSLKNEIIKTDEAFSRMSSQNGMKKAFIEYMDDEGILLRPNRLPIIGADAIEFLSQANDTAYKLTWKPSGVEVSACGDLGFSYGIYTLILSDTTLHGTYVSIWKKQEDGKWKFVLDTGNEGINESSGE